MPKKSFQTYHELAGQTEYDGQIILVYVAHDEKKNNETKAKKHALRYLGKHFRFIQGFFLGLQNLPPNNLDDGYIFKFIIM